MATTFPLTTYPLNDSTRFINDDVVMRDLMDDGSMRIRVLSGSYYRLIRCVFNPLPEATAQTLIEYLLSNRDTLFDMYFDFQSPQDVYTGYIWSDPQSSPHPQKATYQIVSCDFRGEVV